MRTTVEITNAQRSKLLELAARRGEKGFSRLVQEAIDLYLLSEEGRAREARASAAVAVLGTLDDEAADAMETVARGLRSTWR